MDELREIAISRGDRQSLSILFYQKDQIEWKNLNVFEMLEYVKLGNLAPATTRNFTRSMTFNFAQLDGWPLAHLQYWYKLILRGVPKEDRLSTWLCSGVLAYEDSSPISFDRLYDENARLSVSLRLTEPRPMKSGQPGTRAADAFILNARVALAAHRSDRHLLKSFSGEDCQKIVWGILYALVEGEHLDFSNTEAEMWNSDGRPVWTWFDHAAQRLGSRHYETIVTPTLHLLDPAEIYSYVHKISPGQNPQGGQVKNIIEGLTTLSI
jgi:hypothetical protein